MRKFLLVATIALLSVACGATGIGTGSNPTPSPSSPGQRFDVTATDTDHAITMRSGQTLEVVVLNKRLDVITVVLGEGVLSVKCDLVPTRNASAYVGNAMGREIVYERSREQVQADIDRLNPTLRQSTRRRT